MKTFAFTLLILLCSINASADVINLSKGLKELSDKLKQSQQSPKPQQSQQTPKTKIAINPESESNFSIDSFRSNWCSNVDNSSSGPLDYKGVKVGDICLLPDELISGINMSLKSSQKRYDWMTNNTSVESGTVIVATNVTADDKRFFHMTLVIDAKAKKAYLGSFSALICAADLTNSLDEGNSFRIALEKKYGKPSLIASESEKLKAQIDALEKENKLAKEQSITIQEAKRARDADITIQALKAQQKATEKYNSPISAIAWDYEKSKPIRPHGLAVISPVEWFRIRDLGGCDVKKEDNSDVGFVIEMSASKEIKTIGEKIDTQNTEVKKSNLKNAPSPSL